MKIYASDGKVTFECDACGEVRRIPPAKSKRAFIMAFNKFVRMHVWRCESRAQALKPLTKAQQHKRTLKLMQRFGATLQ